MVSSSTGSPVSRSTNAASSSSHTAQCAGLVIAVLGDPLPSAVRTHRNSTRLRVTPSGSLIEHPVALRGEGLRGFGPGLGFFAFLPQLGHGVVEHRAASGVEQLLNRIGVLVGTH